MKAYRIIHIAANIAAIGLLGGFLAYFLISYGGLPERIGVHFSAADGQFDVFADKLFGFYPFVAGGVLITVFSLLTLAVKKLKKPGLNVTAQGDIVMRGAATLLLDLMKLVWSAFFSFWTHCVVHQVGMGDGTFLDAFRIFFIVILIAAPILFSRIQNKYRATPRESEDSDRGKLKTPLKFRIMHIIANIAAIGALTVMLIKFLIVYDGLPERIGVHFGHRLEFDVIAEKIFGFYPFVMGFALIGIFSLANIGVNRIKRIGMSVDAKGELIIRCTVTEVLDTMKLIWSVYFSVWAYCVIHQTPMNGKFVSTLIILFLALFPVAAVIIIITAKKHRIKDYDRQ